ncbi:hypothetical protein CVT24_003554 [Panaeolus cyanescens]|uniref:F-box domain-containing protein n=1 Tax=Panaeolus cyanescens TaxID=181874 RepID=A0A409WN37_9AGAR|nr:hypothetical protein CVT24_003554 [Panaeolus cyanescens]
MSLSTLRPTFPPELLSEVVGHLVDLFPHNTRNGVEEMKKEMKKIATVSKSFLPIARAHLFKNITIPVAHIGLSPARVENLANLLSQYPYIERYVKSIVSNCCFMTDKAHDGRLLSLLNLPNVQTLTIGLHQCHHGKPTNSKDWYEGRSSDYFTHLGFRSILEYYLYSGSLTTLKLQFISGVIPYHAILSSTSLDSLQLHCCDQPFFKSSDESLLALSNSSSISKIRIRSSNIPFAVLVHCQNLQVLQFDQDGSIDFRGQSASQYNAICTPLFPSLKRLQIILSACVYVGEKEDDDRQLNSLLDPSPSLNQLTLLIPLERQDLPLVPHLISLESLTIKWSHHHSLYFSDFHRNILRSTVRTLSSLSLPSLKHLCLFLTLNPFVARPDEEQGLMDIATDGVLSLVQFFRSASSSARLPSLQKVSIFLDIGRTVYFAPEERVWDSVGLDAKLTSLLDRLHDVEQTRFDFNVQVSQ